MQEIMDMLKEVAAGDDVAVAVDGNTPVIQGADGTNTAVNPDGTVNNSDPNSASLDTANSNQTTKGGPGAAGAGGAEGAGSSPSGGSASGSAGAAGALRSGAAVTDSSDEDAPGITDQPLANRRGAQGKDGKGRLNAAGAAEDQE